MKRLRTKKSYLEMFRFIISDNDICNNTRIEIDIDNKSTGYNGRLTPIYDKTVSNDVIGYHIHIRHNFISYFKKLNISDLYEYGDFEYFRALGIREDQFNDAISVRVFLHELAHIGRCVYMKNKFNINYEQIKQLDFIERTSIKLITNDNPNISALYKTLFSTSEYYAGLEAYASFPIVWNKLKRHGYIK